LKKKKSAKLTTISRFSSYTSSGDASNGAVVRPTNGNPNQAYTSTVVSGTVNPTNAGGISSINGGAAPTAHVDTVTIIPSGSDTVTSPATPTNEAANNSSSGQKHQNLGLIVGTIAGSVGIILVVLIGVLVFYRVRRGGQNSIVSLRSNADNTFDDGHPSNSSSSYMSERPTERFLVHTVSPRRRIRTESIPIMRYPIEASSDLPYTPASSDPFSSPTSLSPTSESSAPRRRMSRTEMIDGMMFEMHPSANAPRGRSSRDVSEAVESVVTGDESHPRKEPLQTNSGEVGLRRVVDGEDAPPPAYAREVENRS
jgi:hypothetical protein